MGSFLGLRQAIVSEGLNGRRISGYDKAPRNLYEFRA
jgi:hypothetical protein